MVEYHGQDIRDHLQAELAASTELDPVSRDDFLVYLMGPYTTIDLSYYFEVGDDTHQEDLSEYEIDIGVFDHNRSMQDILRDARTYLRAQSEVNAFIATDAGIPRKESDYEKYDIPKDRPLLDAVAQSKRLAAGANCVLYVLAFGGLTDGVSFELGSVLEHNLRNLGVDPHRYRVLREEGFSSAAVQDAEEHYDVSFRPFATDEEFHAGLRQEVNDVFRKQHQGKLDG